MLQIKRNRAKQKKKFTGFSISISEIGYNHVIIVNCSVRSCSTSGRTSGQQSFCFLILFNLLLKNNYTQVSQLLVRYSDHDFLTPRGNGTNFDLILGDINTYLHLQFEKLLLNLSSFVNLFLYISIYNFLFMQAACSSDFWKFFTSNYITITTFSQYTTLKSHNN